MSKPRKAKPVARTVRRMKPVQVEEMMVHVIRLPGLLADARRVLKPEYFDPIHELDLLVLWEALLDITESRPADRVKWRDLCVAVHDRLEDYEDAPGHEQAVEDLLLEPEGCGEGDVPGLIYHALKVVTDDDLSVDTGALLLKRFCAERGPHDQYLSQLSRVASGGRVIADAGELIRDYERSSQELEAIGARYNTSILPDSEDFRPRTFWQPDVKFFTEPTGGFSPPGIYGLCGPKGQGKTLLAVQVAVAMARLFKQQHRDMGKPLRTVHCFFYEMSRPEMLERLYASIAQVDRTRLKELWSNDAVLGRTDFNPRNLFADPRLTRTDTPAGSRPAYEHELARAAGMPIAEFPGESERLIQHVRWVDNLHIHMMTGKGRGEGGIDEIASELDRSIRDSECNPGFIIVDYLNRLVTRYARGQHVQSVSDEFRFFTRDLVDFMSVKVCERFDLAAFVTQQLKGAVTKRTATSQMHTSEAAESSMFDENMHYGGALGNRDPRTQVQALWHSKTRDSGRVGSHSLMKLDGRFGTYTPADDEFTILNNRIEAKAMAEQLGGSLRDSQARRRPTTRAVIDGPLKGYGRGDSI